MGDIKQFYYKKNRLQQLRGFYYTAQTGSPSKAGEILRLSQSSISIQIQSLERDLGVKVFSRDKKKLTLTQDGQLLYEMAVPYLQGIDSIYETFLEKVKEEDLYTLDIAANHVSVLYILPKILYHYRQQYPDIKIVVRNLPKDDALTRLKNGEIHMFFYPLEKVPPELEFVPLVEYSPILLTRKDHPLALKKNVLLEEVANYELIRIDPHLITLPLFEEILEHYKIKGNIELEMGDWEILKKFVQAGLGVAIISNISIQEENSDLVGIKLDKYFPPMQYGICVKKEKSLPSYVNEFISFAQKRCSESDATSEEVE